MDNDRAAETLLTIRTLMERSALYRGALAPILLFIGALGVAGTIAGLLFHVYSPRAFVVLWAAVGLVCLAGSFLMVRRQALKDHEPFWSPPTRRVALALLPAFTAGLFVGLFCLSRIGFGGNAFSARLGNMELRGSLSGLDDAIDVTWLPLLWIILYGCALNAAGFFMMRGIRILGWVFVLGGAAVLFTVWPEHHSFSHPQQLGHLLMGAFFGLLHLAAGGYVHFTETGKNAA
jgi:hypothetical protein